MKALRIAVAAGFAALAAGAANAEMPGAHADSALVQKLRIVSLRTEESLTRLVIASADARLRSKIDNLTVRKPFPQTLPAFTVASAFTD